MLYITDCEFALKTKVSNRQDFKVQVKITTKSSWIFPTKRLKENLIHENLNYSISKSKWTKKPALLVATLTEKCPSWPGTTVTICMSYKKHGTRNHQLEEFGKGQKETRVHMSYQHLRILHAGILLAWVMPASPGRISSDNGWHRQPWN